MKIVGRKREQKLLKEAFNSGKAEFIALYGRRRVGKTYLIKNFFENLKCTFVYVSGMKNGRYKQQLQNFATALQQAFIPGLGIPENWMEAFKTFSQLVDKVEPKNNVVLFLDELPWLSTKRSQLLEALDFYWNRYWSHDPRIKLVICGSAASWIINKIIYNKGGLYNRVTYQIRLEPFTLKETKEFLKFNQINLNNRHILEIYMATGGVAYYLSKIRKSLSAAQNIDEIAFSKQGVLYQDFDILFSSIFDNPETYSELVRLIAGNRYGINQNDLFESSKMFSSGGRAKQKLIDLEEAGFIISFLSYGHKKKGIYYRLVDEYTLFYLKWIEPFKKSAKKFSKVSWTSLRASPSWKSWSGYAFETICMKHVQQIRDALGLDPSCLASTWRHVGKKEEEGAQIDLLFDRSDDAVTICEIKYTDEPFKIDKEYHRQLVKKMEIYKKITETKKQIFLAFVTSSALKRSLYSEEEISAVIKLEDLFK